MKAGCTLCVVIDLFSRRVVGWSAQSRMIDGPGTPSPSDGCLAAKARQVRVTMHSDQGSQFTSREWQTFLRQHDLETQYEPTRQLP